jgi:hypothetical protein
MYLLYIQTHMRTYTHTLLGEIMVIRVTPWAAAMAMYLALESDPGLLLEKTRMTRL